MTIPASWFDTPEPDGPTPLTVTADGQVYGHLALWNSCHTGFDQCLTPPRNSDGYQAFHVGEVETDTGPIAVGKIMYAAKHAPLDSAVQAASRHYDDNGHVGAYVRAVDGRHGIWLAGAVRPGIDASGLRELRANPPSGDWRMVNNRLSLIAALAVPVPGFPVARVALAASGEQQPEVLLLGYTTEEETMATRGAGYVRKKRMIQKSLVAAPLTAKRRNALSARDFAIPESRAYPIYDLAHARNALARSSGKPEEARVRRAVCRRYPDLCASK